MINPALHAEALAELTRDAVDRARLEPILANIRGDAPPDLGAEARRFERAADALDRLRARLALIQLRADIAVERLKDQTVLCVAELRALAAQLEEAAKASALPMGQPGLTTDSEDAEVSHVA